MDAELCCEPAGMRPFDSGDSDPRSGGTGFIQVVDAAGCASADCSDFLFGSGSSSTSGSGSGFKSSTGIIVGVGVEVDSDPVLLCCVVSWPGSAKYTDNVRRSVFGASS